MNSSDEKKKIILGSDHAGFNLKKVVKAHLEEKNLYEIVDVGTNSPDSCDFPDYAERLSNEVLKDKDNIGIVVCGSGIGVSITANKIPGIRCALVHDYLTAKLARQHTNCNVIAIGEFIVGTLEAKNIVDSFLDHDFIAEEKYIRRVNKITDLEKRYQNLNN